MVHLEGDLFHIDASLSALLSGSAPDRIVIKFKMEFNLEDGWRDCFRKAIPFLKKHITQMKEGPAATADLKPRKSYDKIPQKL